MRVAVSCKRYRRGRASDAMGLSSADTHVVRDFPCRILGAPNALCTHQSVIIANSLVTSIATDTTITYITSTNVERTASDSQLAP